MAITPPRSNVQLMSPAALLANNQRNQGRDFFDSLLSTAMGFFSQQQQRQFQRGQDTAAQEAANERTIAQLIAGGEAVPADNLRIQENPLLSGLTTFELGGREFVSGREISSALLGQRRLEEVESIGGRDLFEGTTYGDIEGTPSGFNLAGPTGGTGASVPANRVDEFTVGDKDATIAALNAAINATGGRSELAGTREFYDQQIQRVEADERFSRAEQLEVLENANPATIDMYVDSVSALREHDRDIAADVGKSEIDFRVNYQVQQPDGNRRDVTTPEAHIAARVNQFGTQNLSPEELEVYNGLDLRERRTVMDVQAEMMAVSSRGANDPALKASLSRLIEAEIKIDDTTFDINNELFLKIARDTGLMEAGRSATRIDPATIDKWLSSDASLAWRNAYAVTQYAGASVSQINRKIVDGQIFPFNIDAAINTPGSPIHNDAVLISSGHTPSRPLSAAEYENQLTGISEMAGGIASTMDSGQRQALAGALRGSDYNTKINDLTTQAELAQKQGDARAAAALSLLASMDSTSLAVVGPILLDSIGSAR